MDGQAILTVSAAVVALTQIVKWGGIPDKWGPIAVILLSALGVAFWGYSEGTFERTKAFAYFAGGIAVATSAAGVFGFTRAATSAVVSAMPPPGGGAGSSPTVKSGE
jgi:O-antigen/teichoic acid export membrane protein